MKLLTAIEAYQKTIINSKDMAYIITNINNAIEKEKTEILVERYDINKPIINLLMEKGYYVEYRSPTDDYKISWNLGDSNKI